MGGGQLDDLMAPSLCGGRLGRPGQFPGRSDDGGKSEQTGLAEKQMQCGG